MLYFLLAISTLMATGKSVVFKKIGVDSKSLRQFLRFNGLSFSVAALTALALSGFDFNTLFRLSPYSAVMSVLLALSITVTYLAQIKALSLGNSSATMLIYSCGFLIPVVFGAVSYKETLSVADLFAVVLLIISLFLIIAPEKRTKISFKWLLLSLIAMTGSGCTAILQKIHQHSPFADEFMGLSILEFIVAAIILSLLTFLAPKVSQCRRLTRKEGAVGALNGIFLGVLSLLNLNLAGKLPAIILFPVYNIGSIILTGILCTILYKEKNTPKGIIGFAVGCIAIMMIGVF